MKKLLKFLVIFIITLIFAFIGWCIWSHYLEYYWHTETFVLYQKGEIIRPCNGEGSINPTWDVTAKNKSLIDKGINYSKQGLPITIFGRGVISKSGSDIFVNEIYKINSGINPECEIEQ